MNIITEQLVDIYQNLVPLHKSKLSIEDSHKYFNKLLDSGNIITLSDKGNVIAYVEFFRILPSQLRKILDNNFYTFDENITDGYICYINDLFIYENYRNTSVIRYLTHILFKKNENCDYFIGHEIKRNRRLRIRRLYGERKNNYSN